MNFVADLDTPGPSCSNHVNLQTNGYNPQTDSRPISGLRTSYHGVAYQVQWNMVVAIEAKERWDKSEEAKSAFTFKTKEFKTEDPDAGKFDDVVWKYEIGGNGSAGEHRYEYNFLQAKHKLNKDEEISFDDLIKPKQKKEHVKKEEGVDKRPFALEKYFISYKNEIKKGKRYEDGKVGNLIIATNINLNKDLKSNLFSKVKEGYIPILDLMNQVTNKEPDVWEIKKEECSHYNRVREKLLSTYNSTKLVSDLAKCLFDHKPLCKGSFISSHLFDLMQNNIIDESGKFSPEFLENRKGLSQKAINFRALLKEGLENKKSSVDSDFLIPNPKEIAELIASKIKCASNNEVKLARLGGQKRVINENLDKLANCVLVEDSESKVRISNVFWTKDKLPGNLENFRNRFKEELIKWKIIRSNDSILVIADNIKKYKFKITGKNQENKKFQTCKEVLIDEEAFLKSFKINIDISELKLIQLATDKNRLLKLNIVCDNGKVCDKFISGNDDLPLEGQEFRRFLLKEGFEDKRTSLNNDFKISEPTNFADKIASLIYTSASPNNIIRIIKKKSITDNIDKLANYVFVKNDKSEVKFSFVFWKEKDDKLPGNLKEFRKQLKCQLGHYSVIDEQDTGAQIADKLQKYSFKIANFSTFRENLADEKAFLKALEEGDIYQNICAVLPFHKKLSEESLEVMQSDIDEFFSKCRFVINYSQNDLDEFIKKKCRDFTGFMSDFVAYEFQVMIGEALNLSSKVYISEVKQVNEFFEGSQKRLTSLMLIGLTLEYRAKIKLYDIEFSTEVVEGLLKLEDKSDHFLDSDKQVLNIITDQKDLTYHFLDSDKQVLNIITDQKDLTYIKFIRALEARDEYRNHGNYASLSLNSALLLQNHVIEAFKLESSNLLVIQCGPVEKNIKYSYYTLFGRLCDILNSKKCKKIILITSKGDALATDFKDCFSSKYEEKEDKQIGLVDLEDESQEKCLEERTLIFQGKKKTLGELLSNKESKRLVDGEVLFDIIEDKDIRIGSCLPNISDKNSPAYFEIMESIDINHLKDVKDDIFVISGIDKDLLARKLELEEDKIVLANGELGFSQDKPPQFVLLTNGNSCDKNVIDSEDVCRQYQESDESVNEFENVCRQYQESLSTELTEGQDKKLFHLIEFNKNGKFVWNRYYNPKFYIDRHFNKILIKELIIENYLKLHIIAKNIFLVGKIQESEFLRQYRIDKNQVASTLDELHKTGPIFILSRDDGQKKAQQIFRKLASDRIVHWIEIKSKDFIWKCSSGEIETLSQFRKDGSSPKKCNETYDSEFDDSDKMYESELVDTLENGRFVVMADVPGMGKSTTLLPLSESYNKRNPLDWIIKINFRDGESSIDANLRDFENSMDNNLKKVTIGTIVNFLSEIDPEGFKYPLAKALLRHKLDTESDSRILLVMDGFDEIRENRKSNFVRQKKILKLLKFLQNRTQVKVLITTRLYNEETRKLEGALSVLSHNFHPIIDNQAHEYIERIWQNSLKLAYDQNEFNVSYLRTFVTALYDKCREVFGGTLSSFVGVPLQLQLLAVAYMKTFKEFVEKRKVRDETSVDETETELKKAVEKLSKEFNFSSLYENFVARKYAIFFQEKNKFDEISIDDGIEDMALKSYEQSHKLLAFRYLVGDSLEAHSEFLELFSSVKDSFTTLETLNRVGIIHSQENDRADFVHRTFAEYYVSELIFDGLQKIAEGSENSRKAIVDREIMWEFLLHHVFLNDNYNVIRCFINCKISDHPIFVDVETNFGKHERIVHELLEKTVSDCRDFLRKERFDMANSNSMAELKVNIQLSVVTNEGLSEIVEFILKMVPSNYIMDIHRLPRYSCNIDVPWESVVYDCKVNIMKHLLKYFKKYNLCQFFLDLDTNLPYARQIRLNFRTSESPLHSAARSSSFEIVCCLVEFGACTRSKVGDRIVNSSGEPPMILPPLVLPDQGFTPLHCACASLLFNVGGRQLKIIQYLLENGSQVNAKDEGGNTPLHIAIKVRAKYFYDTCPFEKKIHNDIKVRFKCFYYGTPPFEKEIHDDSPRPWKVIRMTSEKLVEDWSSRNLSFSSQLFEEIEGRVKLLVTQKGQPIKKCKCSKVQICHSDEPMFNFIDAANNVGLTPIFLAAASRHWNVVDYLMSSVDRVSVSQYWDGGTTLHFLAAEAEKDISETMTEFLNKSDNGIVNMKTDSDETALHWAAKYNNVNAVKVLLHYGADKNAKNVKGQTALDLCQNPSIKRLLTDGCADVNSVVDSDMDGGPSTSGQCDKLDVFLPK